MLVFTSRIIQEMNLQAIVSSFPAIVMMLHVLACKCMKYAINLCIFTSASDYNCKSRT